VRRRATRLAQQRTVGLENVDLDVLLALGEALEEARRNRLKRRGDALGSRDEQRREALGTRTTHLPRHVVVIGELFVGKLVVVEAVVVILVHVGGVLAVAVGGVIRIEREVLERNILNRVDVRRDVGGAALEQRLEALQAVLAQILVVAGLFAIAVARDQWHNARQIRAELVADRARHCAKELDHGAHLVELGALGVGDLEQMLDQRGKEIVRLVHGEQRETIDGALARGGARRLEQRQECTLQRLTLNNQLTEALKQHSEHLEQVLLTRRRLLIVGHNALDQFGGERLNDGLGGRIVWIQFGEHSAQTNGRNIAQLVFLLVGVEQVTHQRLSDIENVRFANVFNEWTETFRRNFLHVV
jgi:hypothetical protein